MKKDIKNTIIDSFQNPETHPTAEKLYHALQKKDGGSKQRLFSRQTKRTSKFK